MKRYHVRSWSESAREMCDRQIAFIDAGVNTIDSAIHFFHTSYRAKIIRYRAAKRFGRKIRQNVPID